MTTWTPAELSAIGAAEELELASRRPDGSLRPFVTIWAVRVDDGIYVRSAYGSTNPWFVRAKAAGTGRIRAGGVETDVRFEAVDGEVNSAVDVAYHAKYDRYGARIVGSVTGPAATKVTLRVLRDSTG